MFWLFAIAVIAAAVLGALSSNYVRLQKELKLERRRSRFWYRQHQELQAEWIDSLKHRIAKLQEPRK